MKDLQVIDPWFTVTPIDGTTFAVSEYGHWEQVHSFLLLGLLRCLLHMCIPTTSAAMGNSNGSTCMRLTGTGSSNFS